MIEKKEQWVIKRRGGAMEDMVSKLGITPAFARILCGRGYDTAEKAAAFLFPESTELTPAEALPDAEKFCFFISEAKKEGKKVRIIGDYDADGVCATFLMLKGLRRFGLTVDYRIPNRITDGYGISLSMVQEAINDGIGVLVTVDNGIVAVEQTELAKRAGLTVLITDHHEPQEQLPAADALVDFKVNPNYSGTPVCGAVVAGKLMDFLLKNEGMEGFLREHIEVLALATVADVMELQGENRIIVKNGLSKPVSEWNLGLKKLAEANRLKTEPTSYSFGFVLAPCINALGRLDIADPGVELLLEENEQRAAELSGRMVEANNVRKDMTVQAVEKASKELDALSVTKRSPIVYVSEDCHESIAGIVAGKLRERYYLPAIVLCHSSDNPGILKGSGRSIESYSIFEGLTACRDYLTKFGGHAQACGLSIAEDKADAFRDALAVHFLGCETDEAEKIMIDLVVNFSDLSEKMISEIGRMEPFGNGNKKPAFAAREVTIKRISHFGKTTKYTRLALMDSTGNNITGVYFGNADGFIEKAGNFFGADALQEMYAGRGFSKMHIIFSPTFSTYSQQIELTVDHYQFIKD